MTAQCAKDMITHVGVSERMGLKLFGREIICAVFTSVITKPKRQGQTYDMQSHNRALCSIAQ